MHLLPEFCMPDTSLTFLRLLYRHLGIYFPSVFARHALNLWGRTHRPAWKNWEHEVISHASSELLHTDYGNVMTYRWGNGDRNILLLPGWNSRASHFRSFIQPLTKRGYRVVGVDPLGHGRSDGKRTNIRQYLNTVGQVTRAYGPFDTVIGHSFGGFCIPFAQAEFNLAHKAVLLATPVSLKWLFTRFCNIIDASPAVREQMGLLVRQLLGDDCWQVYDITRQATGLKSIPSLIIHDEQDHGVPIQHARDIHKSWPGSQLVITRQLGHHRVLKHNEAVNTVIAFIEQS